jgi:hypothetical protein
MRRHLIAVLVSLAMAGSVLAAGGARLTVPDVCVLPDEAGVSVPLVLSGAPELRPSSLRTTLRFDPSQVTPEVVQGLAGVHVMSTVDAEAGRVEVVWHMAGLQPVAPLPAGVLARVEFRLVDGVSSEPRLDLDAGETRSLDGNGRPSHVAVSSPATLVLGGGGLWVEVVPGEGMALVASTGLAIRGRPWILRGRSGEVAITGRQFRLGALEPLATTDDGRLATDLLIPEAGEVFYYLAARDDGTGRPVLGFDSECLPRKVIPARTVSR